MKSMIKKAAFTALALPLVAFASVAPASAEDGTHEEVAEVTYQCHVTDNILGLVNENFEMPTTIRATVPDSVTPGEQFNITNASATVQIPQQTVQTVHAILGWDDIMGNVSMFNVNSQNEAGTVNVADPPLAIPETPVDPNSDLVFTVPGTGGVNAGPFTAGQSGEVTLTAGNINATLEEAPGGSTIKLIATCQPTGDATLTKISIAGE